MSPEQSKPDGLAPPHTYGTPSSPIAIWTACAPTELAGGTGPPPTGGVVTGFEGCGAAAAPARLRRPPRRAGAGLRGGAGLALLHELADLRVQAGDERLLARDQALDLGFRALAALDEVAGLDRLDVQQMLASGHLVLGRR